MFEMEHDGNGDGQHGGKTNHARCKQCRLFFECAADHKLLARRRRGRRTRAMCKACRGDASSESSTDDDGRCDPDDDLPESGEQEAAQSGNELDADTLNQILVRLVASCSSAQQPAAYLSRCSCVCRSWCAGSLNDELWLALLLSRWGAGLTRQAIATCLTYRAQYIRSVTTQVLSWGLGARSTENVSNTHRPVLLEPDGMRSVGFKQVSAGAEFSCAVRPRYTLRKCETNTRASCLPFFARTLFSFSSVLLSLSSLSLSLSFLFLLSFCLSVCLCTHLPICQRC